jgi:hypothetical protein
VTSVANERRGIHLHWRVVPADNLVLALLDNSVLGHFKHSPARGLSVSRQIRDDLNRLTGEDMLAGRRIRKRLDKYRQQRY